MDTKPGGALQSSKVYVGTNEFGYNSTGTLLYQRTFISTPTGICAVYEDNGTTKAFYYVHTDYQGSWLAITDGTGAVTNKYSYDAWGRPRDPLTWTLKAIGVIVPFSDLSAMQPRFDRGYTGHEMLCGFGLINMNGRLYDPYVQRFLSPDNHIQAPDNTQSYNRYSYCINNPLRYTDPTGYTWNVFTGNWWSNNWKPVLTTTVSVAVGVAVAVGTAGIGSPVAIAMISGSVAGFTGGVLGTGLNGGNFGQCLSAGAIGGFTGGIFGAVGGAASIFAPPGAIMGALYGSITGGVLSGISNVTTGAGSFWQGFATGSIFGGIGGGIGGYMSARSQGLNPWTGRALTRDGVTLPEITPLPCNSVSSSNDEGESPQLSPIWNQGSCPRGFAIEKIIMDEYYPDMEHLPNAPTIDGISLDGNSVVSIKSTMAQNLPITNSLKRLADLPSTIDKTLHVVTPTGYIPQNWGRITDFCNDNQIRLILTHQ